MAFMGRGDIHTAFGETSDNLDGNNVGGQRIYGGRWFYWRYYVPLDNTYVIMQMIITFIILIVGGITFLAIYKSTIVDPIASTKKIFINTHLITVAVLLALTILINFISKSEKKLLTRLIMIFLFSIISMLVFLGVKLNLDNTYTKVAFEKIYNEQNISEEESKKSTINIGMTGLSVKTEKENYIDECMKLYNIFKIKTYGTLGIHLLLNILLIYQILKVSNMQSKKDKLNKDDKILFDDEQNMPC